MAAAAAAAAFSGSFLLLPSLILPFLFLFLALSTPATANCYFPNGTDRNGPTGTGAYVPCNAGDEVSMCCATNRTNPDGCRSDGLCEFAGATPPMLWRESCTDPTWTSPACIQLCLSGTDSQGEDSHATDELVTQCGDGSYCCGYLTDAATQCCQQKKGVWIVNGQPTTVNPSSSSAVSLSISTSKPTSSYTSTSTDLTISSATGVAAVSSPSAGPTSAPGSNVGAIAGGVVGGVVGIMLVMGAVVLVGRKKGRRREARGGEGMDGIKQMGMSGRGPGMKIEPARRAELGAEVESRRGISELAS